MAALSTNRISWQYTGDDGVVYRVAAQKALTDQGVLGGAAAVGTEPIRDTDWTLRRVTVSNALGQSRVLVMYSPTATIKNEGTSINVNFLENSTAMTSNGGFIPERHKRKNVTKQTT